METIKRMHGETSNTYLAEKLMKILQNKYSKVWFLLLDVESTVISLHTMVILSFFFWFFICHFLIKTLCLCLLVLNHIDKRNYSNDSDKMMSLLDFDSYNPHISWDKLVWMDIKCDNILAPDRPLLLSSSAALTFLISESRIRLNKSQSNCGKR